MKKEHQLELNFDDPVEYLAPPTYLGGATRRISVKHGATVVHVEIRYIVEYVPTNPNTGRHGK
ncbi:hypothetical protein [Mesorhizobium marinum]|uniref:hypothetical protein n=1 Tax=Mesorhizobium marinum TaxID=3228790 RepID=UPI003465F184